MTAIEVQVFSEKLGRLVSLELESFQVGGQPRWGVKGRSGKRLLAPAHLDPESTEGVIRWAGREWPLE